MVILKIDRVIGAVVKFDRATILFHQIDMKHGGPPVKCCGCSLWRVHSISKDIFLL